MSKIELTSLCLAMTVYLLPTSIALERRHHHRWPIGIVNVFLGWTFLGWVVALAWSASPVWESER